jgi:hypothetical protein
MKLNEMIESIRSAEMKTIIKVSVIVITALWVFRELFFWAELSEYKKLANGITAGVKKEQNKIEKAFGEDFDKKIGMIQSDGAKMESEMHKNIDNLMKKRDAFFKDFDKGAGEVAHRMDHGQYRDDYASVEFGAYDYIFNLKIAIKENPNDSVLKKKLEYIKPIYERMVHEMMRLGFYTYCQKVQALPECSGHSNEHWEAAWDVPQRKNNWETFWSVYRTRYLNTRIPAREFGKPKIYTQQEKDIWEKPAFLDLPGGCDANNNPAWSVDKIIEAKAQIAIEEARQESEQAAAEEAASGG